MKFVHYDIDMAEGQKKSADAKTLGGKVNP